MPGLIGPGTFGGFFGDGSDQGPLPSVATRDIFIGGNTTLDASRRLRTSGCRLFVRGRLTIDSTGGDQHGIISNNGADAANAALGNTSGGAGGGGNFFPAGGNGGAGGVGVSFGTGIDPTNGGSTLDSLGGNGGLAGQGATGLLRGNPGAATLVPEPNARYRTFFEALSGVLYVQRGGGLVPIVPSGGAGGAGGGRGANANPPLNGGGGGGGGGVVFVCAAEIVLVGFAPHLSAHGGNGDSGTTTGNSGSGGGGGGGVVIVVCSKLTGDLSANVLGGQGGAAGTGGHQLGFVGSPGRFILFRV
jgi:hypothetical protein